MIVVTAVLEQGAMFLATIPSLLGQFGDWYASAALPDALRTVVDGILADIKAAIAGIDVAAILADVAASLFGLAGSLFTLFALPFFMFYILADRPRLSRSASGAIPAQWRGDVQAVVGVVLSSFGTYVRAEAILMAILGLVTWAGLMVLSFVVDTRIADFALFLAVVAAVCELIPTFGPIIALVPALLFGLTLGPGPFVAIFLLYLAIMFLEGQVLVPKIEGGQFELHPSLVIVLILAGLALLGPLGAILALPVAAAGRDAFRYAFRRSSGLSPAEAAALDAGAEAAAA
jgi:predicted PurR-regulated permease PerM